MGNNSSGPFVGTIIPPRTGVPFILQESVNFNCLDTNGTSMIMVDIPISNTIGNLTQANVPLVPPYDTIQNPANFINYVSGQFTITFPSITQTMATIWFEGILYQPGKPLCMLYYDDKFTIRPVPDKTYTVQLEVDVRPTELINSTDVPYLEQWWQYIAYGAAKKIFEDRMDYDSINMMMPSLKEQERLVLRRTIVQQTEQRTSTIYTEQTSGGFGPGWWYGGGSF